MPTIQQSLRDNLDLSKYTSSVNADPVLTGADVFAQESVRSSPFLRCPVPPQGAVSPDDLRQFYRNGVVPQYRVTISNG